MANFKVLFFLGSSSEQYEDAVLYSFHSFYYNVTFKHQRKIHFVFVSKEKDTQSLNQIRTKLADHQLLDIATIIPSYHSIEVDTACKDSSVFLLPESGKLEDMTYKAFYHGLPVIGLDCVQTRGIIDQTVGILLKGKNPDTLIRELTDVLRILYFDPEATKIMQKGALKKYKEHYSSPSSNNFSFAY